MNSSHSHSKENELPQNISSSFSIVEGGSAAKKRKLSKGSTLLSGVQFDVLQYENEKLKQVIDELENEKLNHIDGDEFNKLKLQLRTSRGWNLYSNSSEKPYFFKNSDIIKTCFKLNINGQFIAEEVMIEGFYNVLQRINSCELRKISITCKTIAFDDFRKLVSSKKIEICKLQYVKVAETIYDKRHSIDEILNELPNVKEFKCFGDLSLKENQTNTAKNLEKCKKLSNLQKFELGDLSESFQIQHLNAFIKKQNRDVSYVFEFSKKDVKSKQTEIQKAAKKLLEDLSFPCNLSVKFG